MSEPARWTALLVDDEPLAREGLEAGLRAFPQVEVVGHAGSGTEAREAIERLDPDVVFLDIQMPGRSGLEVARELAGPGGPLVVFVTAWDEHAVEAFEVRALDYLVKPWEDARLADVVERVDQRIAGEGRGEANAEALAGVTDHLAGASAGERASAAKRLMVRDDDSIRFVEVDTIDYIQADGNHVVLVRGGTTHRIRATLVWLESVLDSRQFVRVHRSTILNVEGIREIVPLDTGDFEAVLYNDRRLRVSRHYRGRLLRDAF